MAETAASLSIQCAMILVQQLQKMGEVDTTAKYLESTLRSITYTLEEAQKRGTFRGAPESTCRNISIVHEKLQELQSWVTDYQNTGKTKGMLARLRDYWYAGQHLDKLKKLSLELDQAFKDMHLCLSLEICAGVKDLVEHQSSVAKEVFEMIQRHSGSSNDLKLAQAIANKTDIALENVKQELTSNMDQLRRVDANVAHIKDKTDAILRLLENQMNAFIALPFAAPQSDFERCLEPAPFSIAEWTDKGHGKCILSS